MELRVRVLAFSEFIWGFGVYLRVLPQLKENIVNSLGLVLKGLLKKRNEAIKTNRDFRLKRWISNLLLNHQIVSQKGDDMHNKRL